MRVDERLLTLLRWLRRLGTVGVVVLTALMIRLMLLCNDRVLIVLT